MPDEPQRPSIPGSEPRRAEPEQLDDLWLALEEGRLEDALILSETLTDDYPEDGNAALARAATYYEAGLPRETLREATRAGELGTSDDFLRRWYTAAAHYYLWEFDEAREVLEPLLRQEQEFAEAWYLLAQVCEVRDDEVGARRGYDRAFALQPDRFHRPTRIDDENMERAIEEARSSLPAEFQDALSELAVVVEDVPTAEMARSESGSAEPLPPDLLGLFVGADRLDLSVFNPIDQPGVVFLFKANLERVCPTRQSLVEEIQTTLWHELAHYLGFEEEDMADLGLE
jgi:predicted Zn-dependent protease with MMP-like domain